MSEINLETARYNMVEQQIRTWDVLNQQVLDLVGSTPREEYVPQQYRKLAFADMSIPLGRGQQMMAPKLEARLLQALEIKPSDTVLEVGTGSGYMTALLAALAKHVYSVDIFPEFTQQAQTNLQAHGVDNITLETGDAAQGWDSHQPYDVILITGSVPELAPAFLQSLSNNGRMIAIVGESPVMEVRLIRKMSDNDSSETVLFETDLPALINAKKSQTFVF